MKREVFYQQIKTNLFNGGLKKSQVEGIDAVLDEWDFLKLTDTRWLAYMLATDYHETAKTMQAIKEWKEGMNKKYGIPDPQTGMKYFGRGLVQLTWKYNYEKAGKEMGIDLVYHPELALQLELAVQIMFKGMIEGWFTGKKLSHYFDATKEDWVKARRIINGTDKAELIAGYAKEFYAAIKAAQ